VLALWAARYLWPSPAAATTLRLARVPRFVVLLSGRIVASAWQVLRIVLDPRLPIAPVVVTQTVEFANEAARVTYANAMTVTPGTLTLDVDGDTFVIHCLDVALARDVIDGTSRATWRASSRGISVVTALLWGTATALLLMAFTCLWRADAGPTIQDRILAVNVAGIKTSVVLALLATIAGHAFLIDVAIVYGL
jgi:multisubunit Na+/H+ antiporter MnhE subunit/multisubunit Na+/H+ antiporter MnhF subunit